MFREYLSRFHRILSGDRKPVRRPVHRPKIEDLEDRRVPTILFGDAPGLTVSDNGGPVLANAQVRLIFWGTGWNTGGGPALRTQVQNAIDTLNGSPHFYSPLPGADLSQYRPGVIHQPTRVASYTTTYSSPGTTFTAADVSQMLKHEFGSVSDMVYYYYVIPDPNSTPIGCGCTAEHTYWSQFTPPLHEYFGFSRNLATPSLDDLTVLYAHEMAESITDPDGTAIQVNPRNPMSWNEIADGGAQQYSYRVNGVLAQSYWSQAHGKFIVATGQQQNFLVSSGHVLTINGDQLANHDDTITLDAAGNSVRVTLNGETAQFEPGQTSSIVVNTLTGTDVVNVERTLPGVPVTINLGSGVATVNVSPSAHNLTNIQGAVTIHPGSANDQMNVYDQSNSATQPVSLDAATISRPGSALIHYIDGMNTVRMFGGSGNNTYTVSILAQTWLVLTTGNGNDVVNVLNTAKNLTVNLGTGHDTVNLSSNGHNLDYIRGTVVVNGGTGIDDVNLNDQESGTGHVYTVNGHSFSRPMSATVTWNPVFHVTLNGSNAGNTFNVLGVTSGLEWVRLNTGTGSNVVNVGNLANRLDDIRSELFIDGQGGGTTVQVNDQAGAGSPSYSLSVGALVRSGAAPLTYIGIQNLTVNTAADSYFHAVTTAADVPVMVNGDGTLHLSASDGNNIWNLTGHDTGTLCSDFLPGLVTFTGAFDLRGGFRADTFIFADGASIDGSINGENGGDTLDYSAYSSTVIVDLQTGFATGVGGGVATIQNVIGGTGGGAGIYNILVGKGGNVLTGGDGRRNLLIAGASASTLIGGNDDDILIGGTTAYDTEAGLVSLQAIMDYWSGTPDDYATRVANLLSGNSVPLLDASMVVNNGGGNTLLGNGGMDLYYGLDPIEETTDYNPNTGQVFVYV